MKLLFDHNLSHKLVSRLADLFPQASHTRMADLTQATDSVVWDFARRGDFVIVTLDADFFDLLNLYGSPPRVIWIRCGNQPTVFYEKPCIAPAPAGCLTDGSREAKGAAQVWRRFSGGDV